MVGSERRGAVSGTTNRRLSGDLCGLRSASRNRGTVYPWRDRTVEIWRYA